MRRKGGKGGGLLPSCGREAAREEGGEGRGQGVQQSQRGGSKVGGGLQKGAARQRRGMREGARTRRGGAEQSRHTAPLSRAFAVCLFPPFFPRRLTASLPQ